MPYTNLQMERMLLSARAHLQRRDLIGYVCARNVRILEGELTEYARMKNALLAECGEVGEDGVPLISTASPRYAEFVRRIDPIARIEHEPALMMLKYTDVMGELTGEEMLEIDWMLED